MRPEDVIADKRRPYTGAEYMQSLRDGREVYIDGERVADVTTHPAFRNSVRSIARRYDALHDPARQGLLTCPTDTGSGGYTHRYLRVPRSREDLVAAQGAIADWSRLSYGWMGERPTTRRRTSTRSAPTQSITGRTRATRTPGTSGRKRPCRS